MQHQLSFLFVFACCLVTGFLTWNGMYRFEDAEKALESYIATHGAALPQGTLKRLVSARTRTSWGKFEVTNGNVSSTAINYAEEVMEGLEEIEKELYQAVWSQSGT